MNKITIVTKTGQVAVYRMPFMTFDEIVEKGKDYVTSGSAVEVTVTGDGDQSAKITINGNMITTEYK